LRPILALLLFLLTAAAATAQPTPQPSIAPPGEWVEQLAMREANPAQRDAPFQTLLLASQSRYGADHIDHNLEVALLIQNSQGLQSLGNVALPWQPDRSELIIHTVRILRGGTVIDLLAGGRTFTVVRRENGLESAMLDGVLTAVMQAEGLAVGDILDLSYTVRQRASALPLRGENLLSLPYGVPVRRLYTRQIWPAGSPMRWRASGPLGQAVRVRHTALGTELVVDLADAAAPQPPAQVPPRLVLPPSLQLTEYRSWAEISRDIAPHYDRAQTLAADSPLRQQIARIAAATTDPRARAMAALRLVQDEIRYFAVTIGDGNYVPATADQTWSRRYGDCKGKVATLLALLQGLGIEAEAVLVNSVAGDALEGRLPQMALFDHVIVRARIDGRSYWLDGTRTGDREIEDLAASRLGWGLPIRAGGAELERLPFAPAAVPTIEMHVTYDASRGLLGAVPFTSEVIFRRDEAAALRFALAQQGEEAFRQMARSYLTTSASSSGVEVSHADDQQAGTFTLRFSGTRTLEYSGPRSGGTVAFQFDNDTITWRPDFTRPEGPFRTAPFLLAVPSYLLSTETVILPAGGAGFALVGRDLDRTVAGVRIARTLSLANGRAVARSTFRQTELEISAAEAAASGDVLTQIRNDRALVRGPAGTLAATDRAAPPAREPTTAREFVDRGYQHLQAARLDQAAADFERAATLDPNWSRPLANRAIVLIHRNNYDEADALLTRAAALDANDFVVHQGRGLIHLARNRPIQAIVEFSRSLELDPGNNFTQLRRAYAYQQLGEFGDAQADLAAILAREPAHVAALLAKARIHAWLGENDEAVAAADALVAADPRNPGMLAMRAALLRRIGRDAAAAAAYAEALALAETRLAAEPAEADWLGEVRRNILADSGQTARAVAAIGAEMQRHPDNAGLLNARCWIRGTANVELAEALADCERAVARAPDNAAILDSRAFVKLRLGQLDGAIADATAALARQPQLAPSLYVRGVARLRKGERAAGEQDLAAARRLVFDIDSQYRLYGVTP